MAQQGSAATDALQLLMADHQQVRQLFDEYERLASSGTDAQQRQQLAQQICMMVTAHANLEEELFYPAARKALQQKDLLDEAQVEHASARDLVEQIQGMDPSEDLYDAKVKVLGEYVKHHVHEEENEMFPQLQRTGMDLAGLGQQMAARKQEMMSEMGLQ